MEIIFGWVILSFIVAFIGSDRKIGYLGTLGLSLLLSPLIGAIVALASQRKPVRNYQQLPPEVSKLYNKARKEYKNGNSKMAIDYLLEAQKLKPNHWLILFNLALTYSDIKNKEKAFYYLDKSVANGYSHFKHIQEQPSLKFLREQPEFSEFAENGYRLPKTENKSNSGNDSVSKLEKLAQLKEKGVLTEEEFQKEKQKILTS